MTVPVKLPGKFLFVSLLILGFPLLGRAQTVTPGVAEQISTPSANRTNAEETFELNIDERRYSQDNFQASTAVGIRGAAENLNLQIGVALAAGRIDVLMRNVHGRVRFRGTLDRIIEILKNRQAPSPSAVSPPQFPVPSP